MNRRALPLAFLAALLHQAVQAEYKPEFNLSTNVSEHTSWGRAGKRFADAVRYQTRGRIRIKTHYDGQFFKGKQTSEFQLLQDGIADFAIGSTINWSPQVNELNLFALPFMFSRFSELDAIEEGEPGRRLLSLIRQRGVIPLAWGENGFREITNSQRPIRRPEDLHSLRIRAVGVPVLLETLRALGADPVSLNWDEAQIAFRNGTVDGQENPIALVSPTSSLSPINISRFGIMPSTRSFWQ